MALLEAVGITLLTNIDSFCTTCILSFNEASLSTDGMLMVDVEGIENIWLAGIEGVVLRSSLTSEVSE